VQCVVGRGSVAGRRCERFQKNIFARKHYCSRGDAGVLQKIDGVTAPIPSSSVANCFDAQPRGLGIRKIIFQG
jgi:hypothetical protein